MNTDRIILKKDVITNIIDESNAIFYYLDGIKIYIPNKIENIIDILKQGCTFSDLVSLIGDENSDNLLNYLSNKNMLSYSSNNFQDSIVENQIYYFEQYTDNPNIIQTKLENRRVLILGLGGIGANTLQCLVSSGIKHFILIDDDIVQLNNLNRQYIYNKDSLGNLKVEESRKYILSINPECTVSTYCKKVLSRRDLKEIYTNTSSIDIFVNAADHPYNIQEIVLSFCKEMNIPYITAGMHLRKGSWGPLLTEESYKKNLDYPISTKSIHKNSSLSVVKGSYGPTNNIISSHVANDIIMYFIGESPVSLEKIYSLDFYEMLYHSYEVITNHEDSTRKI